MSTQSTFRTYFQRSSRFNQLLLPLVLNLTSYPKLIIEVFIRTNLGERYFSKFAVILISLFLIGVPNIPLLKDFFGGGYGDWKPFISWYAFAAAFMYFSYRRWKEVETGPSAFDLKKYSLSSGNIHLAYLKFILKTGLSATRRGKVEEGLDLRIIEIYIEPLSFLLPGIILLWMGQLIGIVIIFCSICYWANSAVCYKIGDDFILDTLDGIMINEDMSDTFLTTKQDGNSKGFRLQARKPATQEVRETIIEEWRKEGFERVR